LFVIGGETIRVSARGRGIGVLFADAVDHIVFRTAANEFHPVFWWPIAVQNWMLQDEP
jgi:hypothetical protein